MIAYGYHVDSNYNPERFQTAVADSIADGNSFGVLYWRYTGTVFILHPSDLKASDEDTDYYYELYGVKGMSGDVVETTTSEGSYSWYLCIRYSKSTPNTSTSIYAHAMTISDYFGVFGGDLTKSSIYSWHGTDECPSYYLYSYLPLGSEWGIVDGNLPFLVDSVTPPNLDDTPDTVWLADDEHLPWMDSFISYPPIDDVYAGAWKITEDDDCPWLEIFPNMEGIEEIPLGLWKITEDDDCPWLEIFPNMEGIEEIPLGLWKITEDDDCPWKKIFPKLYKPVKELPKKYKYINVKTKESINYCINISQYITYNIKIKKGVR